MSIDNFNVRFKSINKLEEPNHQAVMRLVQDQVKSRGEQYTGNIKKIRNRSDVAEDYLNGIFIA